MLLTAGDVQIVIATTAPPAVAYAAEELQRYIDRMSRNCLPVRAVSDAASIGPREIVVGDSPHRAQLFPEVAAALPGEGYILRTRGPHLLALGGSPRGTLYAVYDLLERLGVRWWTPWAEDVPVVHSLAVGPLDVTVRPPLVYRAIWYRNAMDADWQARMRLDAGTMGPVLLRQRHGGMERFAGDYACHTYQSLVPPDEFFDTHPEYFSEVTGRRLRHQSQLCCTNPQVADIAAERAAVWLRNTPGARIVSVTQNDHGNWCTCANCAAIIEREGSPTGPALHLANEVARRLEKEFPDAWIDTFAYAYTWKPPAHMTAHPNVLVRIAPIGNCVGHSIPACPVNRYCFESVKEWSKVARQLFVWHYVTDFFHYMTPFPNLPPLADDLRFYVENGVKGIFLQGDGTSLGGDMSELKAYLMSRLLWDPTLNAAAIRKEFLNGYYRAAGPAVEEYVSIFEKTFARKRNKEHLHLYRSLWENEAGYLERPVLSRARGVLADARKQAQDDPTAQERLDRIEMGLNYTELFYYERPGLRKVQGKACLCPVSQRRENLCRRLFAIAGRANVSNYGEAYNRHTTMSCLRRAWLDSIGRHAVVRLATGGGRAVIVPGLGGRIVEYGPAGERLNLLGRGSTRTFGYPCCGGYEEYSQTPHQSPGFCESYKVLRKTGSSALLRAELEIGLAIERSVRLEPDGEVVISSKLINPKDAPLAGCARAHLEIDLATDPKQVEVWFLRGQSWQRIESGPAGSFYEADVPDAWAFWSPSRKLGLVQRWSRQQVGAAFLGTIAAEPTTLALDLTHHRYNQTIPPGQCQAMTHRFAWIERWPIPTYVGKGHKGHEEQKGKRN